MGHNNNNSGLLWGTTITIWELYGHKNNNKGATQAIIVRGLH